MAASDKLSKLKKALEDKKKGGPAKAKEAPEPKKAEKPVVKPVEKAPEPKKQEKPIPKPVEKAPVKSEKKPEPSPPKETKKADVAAAPKAPQKPAPMATEKKSMPFQKPDLNKRIIDTILNDPRLSNHDQVAKVVIASIARKDEIDSKVKSIKDVVNEEIKKLLG